MEAVMDKPCLGCTLRTVEPNCHSTCARYRAASERVQERRKVQEREQVMVGYEIRKHHLLQKRKG